MLKASPGTLYALQGSATLAAGPTVQGYILLFDATTVPADGAVIPRKAWPLSGAFGPESAVNHRFDPPLAMTTGIVVVFSTSLNPFIKAGSANGAFSAELA